MKVNYKNMDKLYEQFNNLYLQLSDIIQSQFICESEITIFNLRKLFNLILVNSKSNETKQVLKDILKVLTKMEMSNLPLPPIRQISDKTFEL